MYELVYISQATREMSEPDLMEILDFARKNNASLNVTGVLLYHKKQFIQLLEGEKATVKTLYNKIAEDPRHTDAVVFWENDIEQKSFSDWSMGFKLLSDLNANSIEGFTTILEKGFLNEKPEDLTISKKILLAARENL